MSNASTTYDPTFQIVQPTKVLLAPGATAQATFTALPDSNPCDAGPPWLPSVVEVTPRDETASIFVPWIGITLDKLSGGGHASRNVHRARPSPTPIIWLTTRYPAAGGACSRIYRRHQPLSGRARCIFTSCRRALSFSCRPTRRVAPPPRCWVWLATRFAAPMAFPNCRAIRQDRRPLGMADRERREPGTSVTAPAPSRLRWRGIRRGTPSAHWSPSPPRPLP